MHISAVRPPSSVVAIPPWVGWSAAAAVVVLGFASPLNTVAWAAAGAVLAVVFVVVGRRGGHPALLMICIVYWVEVAADILGADISGMALSDREGGDFRNVALFSSLAALVSLAAGMQVGIHGGVGRKGQASFAVVESVGVPIDRSFLFYLSAQAVALGGGLIGELSAALQQPLIGVSRLKLVGLFVLSAAVISNGRGFALLALVVLAEVLIGTGFISSFQSAVVTVLLAFLVVGAEGNMMRKMTLACATIAFMIVISIEWTGMKREYRTWVSGGTSEQIVTRTSAERVEFIVDWVAAGRTDYAQASEALIDRLGYTKFYGVGLERKAAGLLPADLQQWWSAVLHILMPRLLFEKAALDDTAITSAVTGLEFGRNTSVSVGWVAQAHLDFGFPMMVLPVFIVGMVLGLTARYFLTSSTHPLLRHAFTCAALAFTFEYGANIDKMLGGFLIGVIVLGLIYRFGADSLQQWLRLREPEVEHSSLDVARAGHNLQR